MNFNYGIFSRVSIENGTNSNNNDVKVSYFTSFDSLTGFAFGFLVRIYGGIGHGNIAPSISIFTCSTSSSLSHTFSDYSTCPLSYFFFVLSSLVVFFHGDLCCVRDDAPAGDVGAGILATISDVSSMTPTKPFSLNIQINSLVDRIFMQKFM